MSYVDTMSHIGTHVDAPNHFIRGGRGISDLDLETFCGDTAVVQVLAREHEAISARTLEELGGHVKRGDIVLIRTGWGRLFSAETAAEYSAHPYCVADVADWLLEREVKLLGIDTVSPDQSPSTRPADYEMPMHVRLLSSGVPIVENLNLERLETRRCELFAFPLRLVDCDGAPVRAVASVR